MIFLIKVGMAMNFAIVDDEEKIRNWICITLIKHFPHDHFVMFSTGKAFLEKQEEFEGVFLDMDLVDEKGYEIAKNIISKNCYVCYVTSHAETAMLGYCSMAIGFVLKNRELEEHLVEYMYQIKQHHITLHLHTEDGYMDILLSHILYGEVNNKTFLIHLRNKRTMRIMNMTLSKFISLSDQFIKINQSQAVHKAYVKEVNNSTVRLECVEENLFISRNEKNNFLKELYR